MTFDGFQAVLKLFESMAAALSDVYNLSFYRRQCFRSDFGQVLKRFSGFNGFILLYCYDFLI